MTIPPAESLTGRLLVATPVLVDPNFRRAVVYLLAHGADGAIGVVLNRPSELPLKAVLPQWAGLAADPAVVFSGGPVAPGAAICLARVGPGAQPPGWTPVAGSVGTLDVRGLDLRSPDVEAEFGPTRTVLQGLRVFSGYAGWGSVQLAAEIEIGSWYVVAAAPEDPFTVAPEELWRAVLRRQPGQLAMLATFPDDPTMN